jgi:hypothetical protein
LLRVFRDEGLRCLRQHFNTLPAIPSAYRAAPIAWIQLRT